MSLYILVIQGGVALGSFLCGVIAEHSIEAGLVVPAIALVATLPAVLRWRLTRREPIDLEQSTYWSEPVTSFAISPDRGPVLITVDYRVALENITAFKEAMQKVRRIRKRTGASRWGLYQDSNDAAVFTETFVVSSWEEHLRQHGRTTATDQLLQNKVRKLLQPGTDLVTRHALWAYT